MQLRIRTVRTASGTCAVALIALALLAACDRRTKSFVAAEEEPAMPDRVSVPGLENPIPRPTMPRGMSSADAVAQATGGAATGTEAGSAGGGEIRGTIRLADGVEAGSGVLFVIARSGAGGPPLAVRKLTPGAFPLEFTIGPSDVMIQGRPFQGDISLTARLDSDGNAMTREPGDLAGAAGAPVQPGASDVEIVLKRGEG